MDNMKPTGADTPAGRQSNAEACDYSLFKGQNRDLAETLGAIVADMRDAVWYFCTRLNIVRGQVSATMVNDMAGRFDSAVQRGKRPILIYLGDLDPSGIAIPKALKRNLYDWHSLAVEVIRAALNPEQVTQYGLPVSPNAAKETDQNFTTWAKEFGDQAPIELDAIHPRDLTALTQTALESVYDMTSVEAHKAAEAEERDLLRGMKRRVEDFVAGQWPEVFSHG